MTETVTCLADIDEKFDVFEPDQVLDADQLNRLRDYLDDQTRLTRTMLLGVGILSGLQIQLQVDQLILRRGIAVTTDGDLLRIPASRTYDRFKPYPDDAPRYTPFLKEGVRDVLFELIDVDTKDDEALPLSEFAARTTKPLRGMIAVLYMESYIQDRDLCTEAGCDNLGRDCLNNLKVLLVGAGALSRLKEDFVTPHSVGRKLTEVVAARAILTPDVTTPERLRGSYLDACRLTATPLVEAFASWHGICSSFIDDLFPADPAPTWKTKVGSVVTALAATPPPTGVQYIYEFLNDVTETYNSFRRTLLSDTSICLPSVDAFPKHVILGRLNAVTSDNRTDFYPAASVKCTCAALVHARFLAQKLDLMIRSFKVPTTTDIKITPSLSAQYALEERAIPYFYGAAIHALWDHSRTQRGLERSNYSFLASTYHATGAAASPLDSSIAGFPFFRIEGHVGQDVVEVVRNLKEQIKNKNLPFSVRALALWTDRKHVVRFGNRYGDLHRLHYLVRAGLTQQLNEVTKFNDAFKSKIENSATDEADSNFRDSAREQHVRVKNSAETVKANLAHRTYSSYLAEKNWPAALKTTIREAGTFKQQLGKFVRTDFPTPFDSLISNTHVHWLDWLDDLIKDKDEKADDDLLFAKFLTDHPGAEFLAGVPAGGTFLLLHGPDKKVVADLAMPCLCGEPEEPEPEEPDLKKPDLHDDIVINNGTQTLPFLIRYLDYRQNDFRDKIEPYWQKDLATHKEYLAILKDSIGLTSGILTGVDKTGTATRDVGRISDAFINQKATEIDILTDRLDKFRSQHILPTLDDTKRNEILAGMQRTERTLATILNEVTTYVAKSRMDVKAGTDGFKAMSVVAGGVERLGDKEAVASVKAGLQGTLQQQPSPDLQKMIGAVQKSRGFE